MNNFTRIFLAVFISLIFLSIGLLCILGMQQYETFFNDRPIPIDMRNFELQIPSKPREFNKSFFDLNWKSKQMQFGSIKVDTAIVKDVVKAAWATDINPAVLMAIADKESNFKLKARAKTSSATGLFQFIDKTWLKAVGDYGPRYGYQSHAEAVNTQSLDKKAKTEILNLRKDSFLSAAFAAEMLRDYGNTIAEKIHRRLTIGETYLIHFLGPNDAEKFIATVETNPDMTAAELLPKPAKANRPIFYARHGKPFTLAQVHDLFESIMQTRKQRYQQVSIENPTSISKSVTAYVE